MSQFSRYPGAGSTANGVPAYFNFAALPTTAPDGALAVTLADDSLYIFDGATATWLALASTSNLLSMGTIDSQAKAANGAVISATQLFMQTADATHPGLMSTGTQTIAGAKTFSGAGVFASTLGVTGNFAVNTDKFTVAASSGNTAVGGTLAVTSTLNVTGASTLAALAATTGAFSGDFAVATSKFTVASATGNTLVAGTLGLTGDFAIATNKFNVTASSGNTTIAGTLGLTSNFTVATNKFVVTASSGNTTIAGTLGVTGAITGSNLSGTNTGDVTLAAVGSAPNANGATLSGQALNLEPADATHPGVVTTGTQTFAGAKTFSSAAVFSSTVSLGFTAGSIVFSDGSNLVQDNSNLFYSSTGIKLGVGFGTQKLATFSIKPKADSSATGTCLTTQTSTTLAGSGTAFLTEFAVGDRVYTATSTSGTVRTVTAIASNTSLTLNASIAQTAGDTITIKHAFQSHQDATGNPAQVVKDDRTWVLSNGTAYVEPLTFSTLYTAAPNFTLMSNTSTALAIGFGFRDGSANRRTKFFHDDAGSAWGFNHDASTSTLPFVMVFGGTECFRVNGNGGVVSGAQAALSTGATDGFLNIPTCAGTPTGVPTAFTGKSAIVYDTTNNKLYVYNGGWKSTAALT